jgi:CelD/BcsL family acetyltransferase involved in cellulose biosynthesis
LLLPEGDKHLCMQVYCFTTLDELAAYADAWDRLAAGLPFRTWAWLSTWWEHYGQDQGEYPRSQLFVPAVFDDAERLVGLAPCYLRQTPPGGRVLRWLGSGEVCSDYPGVLCQPGMECFVTAALADFLTGHVPGDSWSDLHWDLLELAGAEAHDPATTRLAEQLAGRGCLVHRRRGPNCWRLNLPAAWTDYLSMLSKGHRKQLRRLQRKVLDTGRAVLHTVDCRDDLPRAAGILVDLHQRRRQALGQPGCFASPRFAAFHRDVMPRLLANGQLQLHWLELDGRPVAAEYHLSAGGIVYAYQAGIEPDSLADEPGRLITMATLRRAIEQGCRAIDFLRGDEPYKAHFRAMPRPSFALRIVPNRTTARLRHRLWLAAGHMKHWIKPQQGKSLDTV